MNTNNTRTSQNNSYDFNNTGQNRNTESSNDVPPKATYPKRRSTGSLIVGIILVLMGTSYIVNQFMPWVFNWINSGLVIAIIAIFAGFALLLKK